MSSASWRGGSLSRADKNRTAPAGPGSYRPPASGRSQPHLRAASAAVVVSRCTQHGSERSMASGRSFASGRMSSGRSNVSCAAAPALREIQQHTRPCGASAAASSRGAAVATSQPLPQTTSAAPKVQPSFWRPGQYPAFVMRGMGELKGFERLGTCPYAED